MLPTNGKILIVDDNAELLAALRLVLEPHVKQIVTEKNPNRIPELLRKTDYDVILLDMNFTAGVNTGNEGLFWLHEVLSHDPDAVVVHITAFGDVELAIKSLKEGATDFIQKSWDADKILSTILAALRLRRSKMEIKHLRAKQQFIQENFSDQREYFIAVSPAMRAIVQTIDKVACTDANIFIYGESGTGKEVIAREIHNRSHRSSETMVSIDLGSLTPSLFEGEMFGYQKGAYTDAREDKAGRIELASGGTLFLDEIGNLPLELQSKLLSVIQRRELTRLGSLKTVPVDFRLICATNTDLEKMIRENRFREDLFYRINTIQIEIPPLRKRPDDIQPLTMQFLNTFAAHYKKPVPKITDEALDLLRNYAWPGNIRELQHTIEKAVILSDSDTINPHNILLREQKLQETHNPPGFNLGEHEKTIIQAALEHYEWNLTAAAKDLGINRSTLYEKIKKYEIKPVSD